MSISQKGDKAAVQKLRRAVECHRIVLDIDLDRTRWRLSPAAFRAHANERAGLDERGVEALWRQLEAAPDAVEARGTILRLAEDYAPSNKFRPDVPGIVGRLSAMEAGILGGFNVTPAKAAAVAAWLSSRSHDEAAWQGRASREGEAAEQQDAARKERDALAAELEPRWSTLPLHIGPPDDRGQAVVRVCGLVSPREGFFHSLLDALVAAPEALPKAA